MGVKQYKPGEHPAGFVGFRVTVAYGDNYHQRYFSTVAAESQTDDDPYFRYQRLSAEKQDVEWQLESLRYQYQRFVTQNHPTTKPERGVGVHCITASFFLDRRKTWQAGFTGDVYKRQGSQCRGIKMKRDAGSQASDLRSARGPSRRSGEMSFTSGQMSTGLNRLTGTAFLRHLRILSSSNGCEGV